MSLKNHLLPSKSKPLTIILLICFMLSVLYLPVKSDGVSNYQNIIEDFSPLPSEDALSGAPIDIQLKNLPNSFPELRVQIENISKYDITTPEFKELLVPSDGEIFYKICEVHNNESESESFVTQLNFNAYENKTWYTSFNASTIPESSEIFVAANISIGGGPSLYYTSDTMELKHKFLHSQFVLFNTTTDILSIKLTRLEWTYTPFGLGSLIQESNLTLAKYYVRNNVTGEVELEGNLQRGVDYWGAEVSMKGKNGDFYVTFEFDGDFMNAPVEILDKSGINMFSRRNSLEYFMYLIIALVAVFIILGLIAIRTRKQSENIVEVKEEKRAPLEVLNIDVNKLKPTRLAKGPKKKVEKVDENALIFNMPTWQVEEETSDASTSEIADSSISLINLHCAKCNSWFETDDWESDLECPKCESGLNVALWCKSCSVFVDVPKPGEYKCPKCSEPLVNKK